MPELPADLAAYLDAATPEQRAALLRLRKVILGVIPEATERRSYGIHAFVVGKPVVWIGHFKGHLSLFGAHLAADLARQGPAAGFKVVGSTIQFQPSKDLPATLVRDIVKARLAQVGPAKTNKSAKKPARATAKKAKATASRKAASKSARKS